VIIPILYEDRSVLALDKPAGWMLVPTSWQKTDRNLQAAILSSIAGGEFWARGRNLRFLRYIHRLDTETTGVLLFGKSPGAVQTFGRLFESRSIRKTYLAGIDSEPPGVSWNCDLSLGPDPTRIGRVRVDRKLGKEAETQFSTLEVVRKAGAIRTLLRVTPLTGRTHQIRVHLAANRLPVTGDSFYGSRTPGTTEFPIALRAVGLEYEDPFTRRRIVIHAPAAAFLRAFGFDPSAPERALKGPSAV